MKIDFSVLSEIIKSIFLLIVGALVTRKFEKSSKLIAYYEHVSVFKHMPENQVPLTVFSHSVILRNSGSSAATNVKIQHLTLPNFYIWPSVTHHVENLDDGSSNIVIPTLVPKEQITISYLYFPPLTYDKVNNGIKCDQGFAQQIAVTLQSKPKKWIMAVIWFLIIFGTITFLYSLYASWNLIATKLL